MTSYSVAVSPKAGYITLSSGGRKKEIGGAE